MSALDENAVAADAGEESPFDAPVRGAPETDVEALIVNLDGYAGPLDVLLELARAQRVDLRKISMVALVDQYLAFVEEAKRRSLELAADYLVMASWLAFLKSKLLIPVVAANDGEPTADEMAARLAFQLQRLEAMRKAAEAMLRLPQLGTDFFPCGAPAGVRVLKTPLWQADFIDLLRAYTRQRIGNVERSYRIDPPKVFSIEEARARIERMLGSIPEWTELRNLAPRPSAEAPAASIVASSFNAALEFAKDGRIEIRQLGAFEPIYIRRRENPATGGEHA
jgi:segregation and condensation protein A